MKQRKEGGFRVEKQAGKKKVKTETDDDFLNAKFLYNLTFPLSGVNSILVNWPSVCL